MAKTAVRGDAGRNMVGVPALLETVPVTALTGNGCVPVVAPRMASPAFGQAMPPVENEARLGMPEGRLQPIDRCMAAAAIGAAELVAMRIPMAGCAAAVQGKEFLTGMAIAAS